MSRENKIQGIILKKQDYSETDQIISIFTGQKGKIRVFIKSAKLQKSKLQANTQPGFYINAVITHAYNLPKLIQVEVLEANHKLYEEVELQKIWFVASELILRAMPDEQPSDVVFSAILDLFKFITSPQIASQEHNEIRYLGLIKFQLIVMSALGLGLQTCSNADNLEYLTFSPNLGGFSEKTFEAGRQVSAVLNKQIDWLATISYAGLLKLAEHNKNISTSQLSDLLNEFINFQLEREIKSNRYLRAIL